MVNKYGEHTNGFSHDKLECTFAHIVVRIRRTKFTLDPKYEDIKAVFHAHLECMFCSHLADYPWSQVLVSARC